MIHRTSCRRFDWAAVAAAGRLPDVRTIPTTPERDDRETCAHVSLLALCFLLTTVTLWPVDALATACTQDGDCAGTKLCRERRCVQVECEADTDCPVGRLCRSYRCVRRQCTTSAQCPVERQCDDGLCVMPPPKALRSGNQSEGAPTPQTKAGKPAVAEGRPIDISLGVVFPVGVMASAVVEVAARRSLIVGVGGSPDYRGFGWQVLFRGEQHALGPLLLDGWVGVVGLSAEPESGAQSRRASSSAVLLGSGRGLFDRNRSVFAMWWNAGVGLTWRHGEVVRRRGHRPTGRRFARLEFGALLLLADAYPAERDYALLPSASLHYGWTW